MARGQTLGPVPRRRGPAGRGGTSEAVALSRAGGEEERSAGGERYPAFDQPPLRVEDPLEHAVQPAGLEGCERIRGASAEAVDDARGDQPRQQERHERRDLKNVEAGLLDFLDDVSTRVATDV